MTPLRGLPRDHGAPSPRTPGRSPGSDVCPHGGAPLGFTGWLGGPHGGGVAEVACSCGGRHEAAGAVRVGVFATAGAAAETSFDPAAGVLRRGPLCQIPVFYTVLPGEQGETIRFSTSMAEVAAADAEPWPAAVAALLAGHVIPVPFTLYREVFRLACGTALRVVDGRQRLAHEESDLSTSGLKVRGRADASVVMAEALAVALSDAGAVVVGDGGGLGAAGLAAARPALPRMHVHVGLPVLERRRGSLDAATVVVDATAMWEQDCDRDLPPFPPQADPWRDRLGDYIGGHRGAPGRAASGQGLEQMLIGMPRRRGRLRAGWRALSAAEPPADLAGASWWRAWRRSPEAAEAHVHAPPERTGDEHAGVRPGAWLAESLRKAASAASAGHTDSHLLEGAQPGRQAIRVVLELLDALGAVPAPRGGACSFSSPVLIAAHPVVVGTVAGLAAADRLELRHRDGCQVAPPPLRDLLEEGWQPADIAPADRERLFAAALVTRRLATPTARRDLLERVGSSPWIDADALAGVLADGDAVLGDAPALHRLYATALRYPSVLARGDV